ncbi:MAG: hypothetical protein H0V44_07315 [Planctomycetes bacterium]|nr:hypothetical protein [Planctomycetota bacterium]
MTREKTDETPRLTSVSIELAASLLRRGGWDSASEEALRIDIAAGAPVNADGTLNLLAYGSWLVRELAERERHHGR